MSHQKHIASGILLLASAALITLVQSVASAAPPPKSPAQQPAANSSHDPAKQSEGERVFHQNCSRCHSAPEGFSPRISGTIVRHMRVRGNLSQKDERALLEFLNP
jgi:cytochrome c5